MSYIFKTALAIAILFLSTGCTFRPRSGHHSDSESGRKENMSHRKKRGRVESHSRTTSVRFERENGVMTVPIEINGVPMKFIFDTGASTILMSETEAAFLIKQGSLSEDDFLGYSQMSVASGAIEECPVVNLKSVRIGDFVIHDIEAVVMENQVAPLLLGQNVLEKFGTIKIDNQKSQLVLDKK